MSTKYAPSLGLEHPGRGESQCVSAHRGSCCVQGFSFLQTSVFVCVGASGSFRMFVFSLQFRSKRTPDVCWDLRKKRRTIGERTRTVHSKCATQRLQQSFRQALAQPALQCRLRSDFDGRFPNPLVESISRPSEMIVARRIRLRTNSYSLKVKSVFDGEC